MAHQPAMNCRLTVRARHQPKMPPCARRLRMILGTTMYAEGVPLSKIAAVAGYNGNGHITLTAARKGVPKRGIENRADGWSDADTATLHRMKSGGASYEEIGAVVGRTANAVKFRYHKTRVR